MIGAKKNLDFNISYNTRNILPNLVKKLNETKEVHSNAKTSSENAIERCKELKKQLKELEVEIDVNKTEYSSGHSKKKFQILHLTRKNYQM